MSDLTFPVAASQIPLIEDLCKKLGLDPKEVIGDLVPPPEQPKTEEPSGGDDPLSSVDDFRHAVMQSLGVEIISEPGAGVDEAEVEKPEAEEVGDGGDAGA